MTILMKEMEIEERFWTVFLHLSSVVGPLRARKLASTLLRCVSLTDRGYQRSQYRVSRATLNTEPNITKLPQEWSAVAPRVRVRRLGLEWDLDLRDNLQRALYYTGTYEPRTLRFFRGELRQGDVFADIGAHVGVHALTVARRLNELGGGSVFAFEPARDTADKLRAAATRLSLPVTVVEAALGSAGGKIELRSDPDFDPADAGIRSQYGSGEVVGTVQVLTFDDWRAQEKLHRLDLVKIDVEGAETAVLEGMRRSLEELRPRAIVLEVKEVNLTRAGSNGDLLRGALRDAGYMASQSVGHRNEVFRPR